VVKEVAWLEFLILDFKITNPGHNQLRIIKAERNSRNII
jgi:hypothetical protein